LDNVNNVNNRLSTSNRNGANNRTFPLYEPVIPEFITVHLGPPDSSAENVTLPFPDYIKNVASSEIYPTWPENAIRANIYAQISVAVNRVFTEYYRSRGYEFDITNSTAIDQSFVRGREIFENISEITDEIFNSFVRRDGNIEPLFTLYCNGTTVTCDGLSQWGTVSLAENGYLPYEIIQYYYGNDANIVQNVEVADIGESAPSAPLRLGTISNSVFTVQNRLNRISENYPLIPKIPNPDGVFDIATENAVREFQRIFELTPDGVVGNATWYRIVYLYNAVKRLAELYSEGLSLGEVSKQFSSALKIGDTGLPVRLVQYYLAFVAAFNDLIQAPIIDGIFGRATAESVKSFQSLFGLPVTGEVDEATFNRLTTAYRSVLSEIPPAVFANSARPFPGTTLLPGAEGEDVRELQRYLNRIGRAAEQIDLPPGGLTEDGVYGPATEAAVRSFQAYVGLPATGIVSAATWSAAADLYNDLGAQTAQTGQFPGVTLSESGG